MPPWLLLPFFGPMLAYWGACLWLSGRLPRERRRAGDARPVPSLFDPATSHRWGGIILFEKTAGYRPAIRRAFLGARLALGLVPVGVVATVVLMSTLPG